MDGEKKVSVRVGKARVVSRQSGSMDMVKDKGPEVTESEVKPEPKTEPKPEKKGWFGGKKDNGGGADKGPEIRADWVDKAIRVLLHVAIIGIPLIFTPLTFEAFELNKQVLLYAIAIIALLLWLIKIIIEKRATLAKTIVTIPILIFLGVDLVATLLSTDMYTSLFGFYGRFNGGFVQFAALIILFFVAINTTKSLKRVMEYLFSFVFVYLVILVIGYLQVFGAYIFPWDFTKIGSFSPIGASLTSLSIFLAAGMGVVLCIMLKESGWKRMLAVVTAIAGLVFLFLTDVSIGWIGLIAGMVIIFAVVVMRMGQFKGKAASWLPLVFLAIAVAFILIPTANLFNLELPTEISLGRPVSWDITKATVSDSPILGSGPETFFQNFSQHRPVQFNDSIIWNMRFDKAGTQLFQDISTVGILGIIALGSIVITIAWEAIRAITRVKNSDSWLVILAPFSTWISLIVVSFFYFFNTTLFFTSWIMMALTIAAVIYVRQKDGEKREHTWSFASSPQVALITSFIFLVVLIGGIVSFYYIGRMYIADMHYRSSQELMIKGEDFIGAASEAVTAAQLNGERSVYHRGAAQAFIAIANQEAIKEEPDVTLVSNNVGLAIDAGRTAATVEPTNVVNHEFLANLYQNAGLYVQGVDQWVIDAFNEAINLDPNNPVLYNNLGKAYVIKSDRILMAAAQELQAASDQDGATAQQQIPQDKRAESEEALNTAIEKFQKAIELKQNYFDAHLSLAQTYDKKGDQEQAIEKMQIAVQLAPRNPDALYELGRVYYNNKQLDEAEAQFRAATELFENHSNSIYSLGLIYLQRDDKENALIMFKKVLELNPDNADVQEKIDIIEGRKTPEAEEEIPAEVEVQVEGAEELPTGVDVQDAVDQVVEEGASKEEPAETPVPTPTATPTPSPTE